MTYPVAERFVSINGEGPNVGFLSLFLRFPACNLRCAYCDTTWVNEVDCPVERFTEEELLAIVEETKLLHLTITGGEPLLQPGMLDLLCALSAKDGLFVEVETNGSVDLAPFLEVAPQLCFTMDYKLPDSGMEGHMHLPNLLHLRETDSLKFVCSSLADLERAKELLDQYALAERTRVYLSPVFGKIQPETIVDFMKEQSLTQLRLQLQLHKFIWSPEQRGV